MARKCRQCYDPGHGEIGGSRAVTGGRPVLALWAAVLAWLWPAAAGAGELRMLVWTDYVSPQLVEKFERETGTHITVDTHVTYEELWERLKTGKSGYDIAVPAEYVTRRLIKERLLEKVDAHRLPGFENIEESWRFPPFDPANDYTVPWEWGSTAFAVDTAVYGGDIDRLTALFEPPEELRGKIGMFQDARDVLTMASNYLSLPGCTTRPEHLKRLEDVLTRQRQWVKLYNSDTVIDDLALGRTAISMIWSGDALRARKRRPSLRFAFPKDGVIIWSDQLVVPKGAPNKPAALAFLRFMLRPENAALQSNFAGNGNAIRGSEKYLDDALRTAPELAMPSNVRMGFMRDCPQAAIDQYEALWHRIMKSR
jgi:spermidine/putrescine transport system substrate-binding protein